MYKANIYAYYARCIRLTTRGNRYVEDHGPDKRIITIFLFGYILFLEIFKTIDDTCRTLYACNITLQCFYMFIKYDNSNIRLMLC